MYSVHAEKWCLRVSVYGVSGITYQPQPQQKPQIQKLIQYIKI